MPPKFLKPCETKRHLIHDVMEVTYLLPHSVSTSHINDIHVTVTQDSSPARWGLHVRFFRSSEEFAFADNHTDLNYLPFYDFSHIAVTKYLDVKKESYIQVPVFLGEDPCLSCSGKQGQAFEQECFDRTLALS